MCLFSGRNETLLDILDVTNGNWSTHALSDQCYRAGPRGSNITLLCKGGIAIFSTASRTWSVAPFTSPLTPDSLADVTLGTAWLKAERDSLTHGSMQLLSPLSPKSCGIVSASGDDWLTFIGSDSTGVGWITMFQGSSIPELAASGAVLLANPRVGTAVAYVGLNGTLVFAGGSYVSHSFLRVASID